MSTNWCLMHLMFSRNLRGLLCSLLIAPACLFAQTSSYCSIAGTVVNRLTNAPVRRAIVTLTTAEAKTQDAVAWTDSSGQFSFNFLPAGPYRVSAVKDGFQPAFFGT